MKQKAATQKKASHIVSKSIYSLLVACLATMFISRPILLNGTDMVNGVKMLLHEGNKADMTLANQIRVNTVAKVNGGLV